LSAGSRQSKKGERPEGEGGWDSWIFFDGRFIVICPKFPTWRRTHNFAPPTELATATAILIPPKTVYHQLNHTQPSTSSNQYQTHTFRSSRHRCNTERAFNMPKNKGKVSETPATPHRIPPSMRIPRQISHMQKTRSANTSAVNREVKIGVEERTKTTTRSAS
jgi:hypothetical protein